MKKRIIVGFIAILLGLSACNVQANTNTEVHAESLELIVAKKFVDEYRPIGINKYTLGDKVLYRTSAIGISNSGEVIEKEYDDVVRFRIIRHGYNKIGGDSLGLASENDAYMATQLALDYVDVCPDLSQINTKYYVADGVTEAQMIRANKIIEKAKELVELGFNLREFYRGRAELQEIGEMQKEEGFVSQTYRTKIIDGELLNYNIENSTEYSITDVETGEIKAEFDAADDTFKIKIPNEQVKDIDTLKVNAKVNYLTDKMYQRIDKIGKFAMLLEVEKVDDVEATLTNTMKDEELIYKDEEGDNKQDENKEETNGNSQGRHRKNR
ncbi:MAG: hypothetical protein HFJ24_01320 [Clostridia bacterium]|nr:hypothetical protein [Clostridia bacterium]MCI9274705.1 hypothetical protein [Clostridia bacterium]